MKLRHDNGVQCVIEILNCCIMWSTYCADFCTFQTLPSSSRDFSNTAQWPSVFSEFINCNSIPLVNLYVISWHAVHHIVNELLNKPLNALGTCDFKSLTRRLTRSFEWVKEIRAPCRENIRFGKMLFFWCCKTCQGKHTSLMEN